jgi:hypothetical protein
MILIVCCAASQLVFVAFIISDAAPRQIQNMPSVGGSMRPRLGYGRVVQSRATFLVSRILRRCLRPATFLGSSMIYIVASFSKPVCCRTAVARPLTLGKMC